MRHRYFVRTQYGVIKIKSLSYNLIFVMNAIESTVVIN
ncbi:hypothetical protein ARSQ2_01500 [Arsenophonus endosymbiont of Bemisia tabaci Q2]|nr:hypothetical protein ARSQ2_01500 [Arsenophonus endosymbiont of Bemisia tabaci Q2]